MYRRNHLSILKRLLFLYQWDNVIQYILRDGYGKRSVLHCPLSHNVVLLFAYQQSYSIFVVHFLQQMVHGIAIEVDLAYKLRLELYCFQLNHNIPFQMDMIEEKVALCVETSSFKSAATCSTFH